MTERDSIVRYLRERGHEDLAQAIEQYADRVRPEPTVKAEDWVKVPSVGR